MLQNRNISQNLVSWHFNTICYPILFFTVFNIIIHFNICWATLKHISNDPYLKCMFIIFKKMYYYIYLQILVYQYKLMKSFSVALMDMIFQGSPFGIEQRVTRLILKWYWFSLFQELLIDCRSSCRHETLWDSPTHINMTTGNVVQVFFGKQLLLRFHGFAFAVIKRRHSLTADPGLSAPRIFPPHLLECLLSLTYVVCVVDVALGI